MPINPDPVQYRDGMPLHESDYTDLEDVIIDAINSRFDLEDGDADPIDVTAGILEDLFARYDITPKSSPAQ